MLWMPKDCQVRICRCLTDSRATANVIATLPGRPSATPLGKLSPSSLVLPGTRVLARVRSESLPALRSKVRLSSTSADLSVIARELALDAVLGLYSVRLVIHTLRVSNRPPDDLSRMWAPQPHLPPQPLECVPRQHAPDRGRWFTGARSHRREFRAPWSWPCSLHV